MEGTRVSDSETVPPSPRACRECGVYEPEHGGIPARSVCVQPEHAQDKSCGLTAEIQARMERGQRAGGRDDVSRGTIVISDGCPHRFASRCHSERQRRIFALERISRSLSRRTVFISFAGTRRLYLRLYDEAQSFFVAGSSE